MMTSRESTAELSKISIRGFPAVATEFPQVGNVFDTKLLGECGDSFQGQTDAVATTGSNRAVALPGIVFAAKRCQANVIVGIG